MKCFRFFYFLPFGFCLFFVLLSGTSNAQTLQDYYTDAPDDYNALYGEYLRGESFVASSSYEITSVQFYLDVEGSPTGDMECKLKLTDENHYPTGAVLSSGTFDVESIVAGWNEIAMSSYELVVDTEYAVYCSFGSGGPPDFVDIYRVGTGAFGDGCWIGYNGEAWSCTSADIDFKIYGNVAEPTPTPTPEVSSGDFRGVSESVIELEYWVLGIAVCFYVLLLLLAGFVSRF